MGFLAWVAGSGAVQGVIIGLTLAFLTSTVILNAVARAETTTVNGWSSIRRAGRPGTGLVVSAALQKALPLVNVFEEAAYWTATTDAAGRRLRGDRHYRLRFAAGGLPPNEAFWSLTATDPGGYLVGGTAGHSSIDSHARLVVEADGSVDILLQSQEPPGARNWVATPRGAYKLMLRAYLPGPAVLSGEYVVPPVTEVRG